MQSCDIDRVMQFKRDIALGRERSHIREEIFECIRKLNIAEPHQIRDILERLYKAVRSLEYHVEDVEKHFGVKR